MEAFVEMSHYIHHYRDMLPRDEMLGLDESRYLKFIVILSQKHAFRRKYLGHKRNVFAAASFDGCIIDLIERFGMCYDNTFAHADELALVGGLVELHKCIA